MTLGNSRAISDSGVKSGLDVFVRVGEPKPTSSENQISGRTLNNLVGVSANLSSADSGFGKVNKYVAKRSNEVTGHADQSWKVGNGQDTRGKGAWEGEQCLER
jgi:hypothetical protein